MKNHPYILLVVFVLFFVSGCGHKDNMTNVNSGGYMEANIGNTQWDASAYGLWLRITKNGTTTHHLSIVGLRETVAASDETLDLSIVETFTISEGVYNLAKENSEGESNSRFFDSEGSFNYEFISGNLTIESLSTEMATGIFNGSLINVDGDSLTVIDGVFNVPIDYQEAVN